MECLELSLASCGPQPAKPWAPPVTPELPTYHEAMSPSTIWYLWRRYCAPKPRCQLTPSDLARSTLNVACDEVSVPSWMSAGLSPTSFQTAKLTVLMAPAERRLAHQGALTSQLRPP